MSDHWREDQDKAIAELAAKKQRERLKPATKNQSRYFNAIETSVVTLCTGPAGTGKTYIACGLAAQMLKDKRIDKIILTRPLVTCNGRRSGGLGFLPGDVNEKVTPYMRPMLDALADFFSPQELDRLISNGSIEIWPLELMRGSNIRNAVLICDEAQNAEYEQLHMLLTRFANNTRVVVCGDASQTDLPYEDVNPLRLIMWRLRDLIEVSRVQLTRDDVQRHPLIAAIDERLAKSTRQKKRRDD
jgi:phosphate starvation-inducible PhoH-like protein